jgi:hypothetical protein
MDTSRRNLNPLELVTIQDPSKRHSQNYNDTDTFFTPTNKLERQQLMSQNVHTSKLVPYYQEKNNANETYIQNQLVNANNIYKVRESGKIGGGSPRETQENDSITVSSTETIRPQTGIEWVPFPHRTTLQKQAITIQNHTTLSWHPCHSLQYQPQLHPLLHSITNKDKIYSFAQFANIHRISS